MANGDLILILIQALDAAARLAEDATIAPEMKTLIEGNCIDAELSDGVIE